MHYLQQAQAVAVVTPGFCADVLCHLHPLKEAIQCKLWTEQANRILKRMWESSLIQQLFKLLCHYDSEQIGIRLSGTVDMEWSLWTGVGALCPAQTRQNNGILQEQAEMTVLKWVWWPTFCVPRGKEIFFHWCRTILDPEDRAVDKIDYDSGHVLHLWGGITGTRTCEWWIFPFKINDILIWTVFWRQWEL